MNPLITSSISIHESSKNMILAQREDDPHQDRRAELETHHRNEKALLQSKNNRLKEIKITDKVRVRLVLTLRYFLLI